MVNTILLIAMVAAAVADAKSREIPIWLFPGTLAMSIILWALAGIPVTYDNYIGAAALFIPTLVLCLADKMGGGDLIMLTAAGFLLGFRLLPAYVFWMGCICLIQAACMEGLNLLRHKKDRVIDAEIPIAPIAAAAYIILIVRGYLCVFGN